MSSFALFLLVIIRLQQIQCVEYWWVEVNNTMYRDMDVYNGWYQRVDPQNVPLRISRFYRLHDIDALYQYEDSDRYLVLMKYRPWWDLFCFSYVVNVRFQGAFEGNERTKINDVRLKAEYVNIDLNDAPNKVLETLEYIKQKTEMRYMDGSVFSAISGTYHQNEEILKNEDEESRCGDKENENQILHICIFIIVILFVLCMISTFMWCSHMNNTKKNHLRQIRMYQKKKIMNGSDAVRLASMEEQRKRKTNGSHWDPERFDDMLNNSQMVQSVMIEDIVSHMQTEGHDGDHRSASDLIEDGYPTKAS